MTDRPSEHSTPNGTSAASDFDEEILEALSAPTRPPSVESYFARDTFEALDIFRGILLEHSRFETLLQGLCEQAVAAVPGADMAGVTLLHHDSENPATAACSDARVVDVDTDQYDADEVPCLEAARTNRIVCVRIDEAAIRWPTFASAAEGIGVKSYLSAPLAVDSEHAGSSRHTEEAKRESAGLREAMRTRATIEQAKGILIAVRGISPDAAFAALAEQSQRENTRLAILAARVVDSAVEGTRQHR